MVSDEVSLGEFLVFTFFLHQSTQEKKQVDWGKNLGHQNPFFWLVSDNGTISRQVGHDNTNTIG